MISTLEQEAESAGIIVKRGYSLSRILENDCLEEFRKLKKNEKMKYIDSADLSSQQKKAVEMYLDGKSQAEIEREMGISGSGQHLQKGLLKMYHTYRIEQIKKGANGSNGSGNKNGRRYYSNMRPSLAYVLNGRFNRRGLEKTAVAC